MSRQGCRQVKPNLTVEDKSNLISACSETKLFAHFLPMDLFRVCKTSYCSDIWKFG